MKLTLRFLFFIILIGSICSNSIYAQNDREQFFKTADGLPSNRIYDVERDHKGFIWLATDQGLARFDGKNFKRISKKYSPHITTQQWVRVILNDSKNNLWAAGKQGLEVLKPNKDSFDAVPLLGEQKKLNIYGLAESQKGDIFVGSSNGLYCVERYNLKSVPLINPEGKIQQFKILSLVLEQPEQLILATNVGAFRYKIKSKQLIPLFLKSGERLYADKVFSFKNGEIWFAIHGLGMAKLRGQLNTLAEIIYLDSNEYDDVGYVYDMSLKSDNIYLASLTSGLITTKDKKIKLSYQFPSLLSLLMDDKLRAVGGFNNGLLVQHLIHDAFSNLLLASQKESNIFEANEILHIDGSIWIADQMRGTCKYSHTGNLLGCITLPDSISAFSLLLSHQNELWVSSYNTLLRIDPQEMVISQNIKYEALDIPDLIYTILEDSTDQLWLAHAEGGITKLDPDNLKTTRYTMNNSALLSDNIYSMVLHNSEIWIVHDKGVQIFDLKTSEFKQLLPPNQEVQWSVDHLHLDNNGFMVLQTSHGLMAYDITQEQWYALPEEIQDIENASIEFVGKNTVWLAHSHGITVWYRGNNHTAFYDYGDGLFKSGYLPSASTQTDDGQLVFASSKGLTMVNPDKLVFSDAKPIISEVSVTYANKQPEQFFNRHFLEDISYQHTSLKFQLANVNFASSSKQQFQYQLEGLADNWVDMGKQTVLLIPRLSWGEYKLRIKSTDSEGNWSDSVSTFYFSVATPWYATLYAQSVYVISVLLLIWFGYRMRTGQLRQRQVFLEAEVRKQTVALDNQNKQLLVKTQQLQEAQQTQSQLLKTLSHEIMTPVTLLQGPSEQLQRGLDKNTQLKLTSIIASNAKRLKVLVQDLMHLAKHESGSLKSVSAYHLSDICTEQLLCFQGTLENKNIHIETSIEQGIYIKSHADDLEQCVSNLLSNAIKYSPAQSRINLSLAQQTINDVPFAVLTVKDQGIGIAQHHIENIFNAQFRAENAREYSQGTGLGLHTIKHIIETLGGHITVDSELNMGSQFTVYLPLILFGDEAPHIEKHITVKAKQGEEYTQQEEEKILLLIDDTPDMLVYLSTLFSHEYTIHTAINGEQGCQLAQQLIPDLIICDVMMPKLDGFGLLERVKSDELTAHIPVILLTANLSEQRKFKGLRLQADEYITKPFDAAELTLKIQNIFHFQKANQALFVRQQQGAKGNNVSPEPIFIAKLNKVLEANYQNCEFTVALLAKEMALSERQLHRKLKAMSAMSPSEYVRHYRLEQALLLLKQGMPVAVAADTVGFNSVTYFSSSFKKRFAKTPKQYSDEKG